MFDLFAALILRSACPNLFRMVVNQTEPNQSKRNGRNSAWNRVLFFFMKNEENGVTFSYDKGSVLEFRIWQNWDIWLKYSKAVITKRFERRVIYYAIIPIPMLDATRDDFVRFYKI